MTESEYRELEPLYDQVKREIPSMAHISISRVQRRYMLHQNPTTGAYRRAASTPTAGHE